MIDVDAIANLSQIIKTTGSATDGLEGGADAAGGHLSLGGCSSAMLKRAGALSPSYELHGALMYVL